MAALVRPATQADSPGAAATVKEVFDEYGFVWEPGGYHADLFDLGGHYLDRGDGFWVAVLESLVVGTAALQVFDPLPGRPGEAIEFGGETRLGCSDCALQRLYVRPSARGQGIGGALLRACLADARGRGRTALEIWSDKRFTDAHRLYASAGASVVADRLHDDPDNSHEWGMQLLL